MNQQFMPRPNLYFRGNMLGSLNKKDSMGERGGTNRPVQSLKKARQEMTVLTVCAGSGCGQMWQAAGVQS